MTKAKDPRTIAASNGIGGDASHGAVTPPVYLSTTYTFAGFEQPRGHEYSRTSNPTRDQLADTVAQLEGGTGAVITEPPRLVRRAFRSTLQATLSIALA